MKRSLPVRGGGPVGDDAKPTRQRNQELNTPNDWWDTCGEGEHLKVSRSLHYWESDKVHTSSHQEKMMVLYVSAKQGNFANQHIFVGKM